MPLNLIHSPAGRDSKEKGVGLGAGTVKVGGTTVGRVVVVDGTSVSTEVGLHPLTNNKIIRSKNAKGFIAKESPACHFTSR